mmetsp:Transcript_1140/g.1627  ORF Transcript_1140/g.1627 Transcript_1140/m.1627 type:complete len:206 (+) Transcript_1140:265-882(+)
MKTNNKFFFSSTNELHGSLWLVISLNLPGSVVKVGKFTSVSFDIILSILLNSLSFTQTDSSNRRVGKHDRRNHVIRDLCVLKLGSSEKTISKTTTRSNSHGSQLNVSNNVAESENAINVGGRVIISDNVSSILLCYTSTIKIQRGDERGSPSGHQHSLNLFNFLSILKDYSLQSSRFINGDLLNSIGITENVNSLTLHLVIQSFR